MLSGRTYGCQRSAMNVQLTEKDVSIVIINWNTSLLLSRALECIYNTVQRTAYEVLVVDNASADGSVDLIESQFPQVRLIENQENVGFARGNNQAAKLAQGRYFLLLNPDAFVHEGAVDRLVDFMDTHPEAGAAGCKLFYEDGVLQRSCTAFPTLSTELWTALWLDRLFPRHPVFGRYLLGYWDMNDVREVDSLLGACLILRQVAVKETGLFDERFFMYSEEVDLCWRLKRAGWKIYFVPTAKATHVWGGSARIIQAETFLRLYKGRVLFFRKHYGRFVTLLYKLVLLLSSVLRIILGLVLVVIHRDEDVIRRFTNYWRLFWHLWAF